MDNIIKFDDNIFNQSINQSMITMMMGMMAKEIHTNSVQANKLYEEGIRLMLKFDEQNIQQALDTFESLLENYDNVLDKDRVFEINYNILSCLSLLGKNEIAMQKFDNIKDDLPKYQCDYFLYYFYLDNKEYSKALQYAQNDNEKYFAYLFQGLEFLFIRDKENAYECFDTAYLYNPSPKLKEILEECNPENEAIIENYASENLTQDEIAEREKIGEIFGKDSTLYKFFSVDKALGKL